MLRSSQSFVYSGMAQAVEVEVKFRVAEIAALVERLVSLGFQEETPRTFEGNILFDTPEHTLRAGRQILRVRQYGPRWVLTHKRLTPDHDPSETHKHREETETAVEDGPALMTVLERLGYVRAFAYEKWRREYADAEGHCVIDETPIGVFAELEGPDGWIDRIASSLGLKQQELLTLSYGRLFEAWRAETGSGAEQMTFAEVGGA